MGKGAPYSFILVHVEIVVFLFQMNKLNILDDFVLCMGKRAEPFIITLINVVRKKLTELSFIPVWVVQLLKFVMGKLAVFVIAFFFGANKMIILNV